MKDFGFPCDFLDLSVICFVFLGDFFNFSSNAELRGSHGLSARRARRTTSSRPDRPKGRQLDVRARRASRLLSKYSIWCIKYISRYISRHIHGCAVSLFLVWRGQNWSNILFYVSNIFPEIFLDISKYIHGCAVSLFLVWRGQANNRTGSAGHHTKQRLDELAFQNHF